MKPYVETEISERRSNNIPNWKRAERQNRVQELALLANPTRRAGLHVAQHIDGKSGDTQIVIGVNTESGTFQTAIGEVTLIGVQTRDKEAMPHTEGAHTVILDLQNSNMQGRNEKNGNARSIPLNEKGIGGAQIDKKTMLFVHVPSVEIQPAEGSQVLR